jgi:hypothetical protein
MSVNISVITNLFPSTYAAYIFSIVILIWLLSELIGGRIIPSLKRGGSTVQKKTSARQFVAKLLKFTYSCLSLFELE